MEPFDPKSTKRDGPEAKIKADFREMLILRDWHVIITHGNLYQHGLPDLYAMHRMYGTRWIETKNPGKYAFTKAQLESFPMFTAKGVGIWVVIAATEEEYQKLFKPYNWHMYLSIMK